MKTNKYLNTIRELMLLTLDREVLQAIDDGDLETSERFPALVLATRQFGKAQAIIKKYGINI